MPCQGYHLLSFYFFSPFQSICANIVMKFYQHIRTKLAFGFLLVTLIPAVTVGIYAMQASIDALRERELNIQASMAKTLQHDIEAFLASTRNDLIFLSQSQPLKRYLNQRHQDDDLDALELARQSLEQEFLAFSRSRGIYYQVRYLDENGQEIVRVDAVDGKILFIPKTRLQNKASRYYFSRTMQLLDQSMFVSPLELNQEQGKIEVPHKPVIRYAIPVFYPEQHQAGIVITNVDASQFLLPLFKKAVLVDQEGFYLANPNANKLWGGPKDLKTGYTFFQDYPTEAPNMLNEIDGNITTEQAILTYQRVSIPNLGYWTLIIQQPLHKILYSIRAFRLTFGMILVGAVFISLIIAFFINRSITKPIEHLTRVIEHVRAGNRKIRADIKSVDELGTLERGFNAMLESITVSEEALLRTKQEAEAANLAKSRFLANMSHELRTPLNAIIGYGEMLQEEIADLGEVELSGDIEKIHLAGKHLLSTINDLLDISKIEAGRMELYTESFYLPNMVNDIVQTLQPLFTKNQDSLKIHYADNLGEMHADLTKTRQILLKMLSNASKFNEEAGMIYLEVLRETDADGKDWILFRVIDSGIGMDAEQKDKLFQVFTQADTSATRKYDGTGLGLAITHNFVQIMGGSINVDSELGQGSTFTVRLPAKVALLVQKRAPSSSQTDVAVLEEGGLVLVIDDELEVRKVLENYLSKQGYQVELADSGEEGLRLARKVLPDVIILDVMMPKMDGWEVLSYLKADAELARIPVIILSLIEDKSVGYSLGASDYLIKPVTREQLSKVLQKYHFSQTESSRLVMIIDDDPVNRDMAGRLFRKAGLRICKVEEARIALNYIQKTQPDLILLDLQMPEMDGFEFVTKLQQVYDAIPVIVFSAKDITIEDRQRLNQVAKIFQKGSYRNEELLAEVKQLLSM